MPFRRKPLRLALVTLGLAIVGAWATTRSLAGSEAAPGEPESSVGGRSTLTQTAAGAEDPWEPFRFLVGTWEGAIAGTLGTGTGIRTYEFILGDTFLSSRHSSVRLPQAESPQGDNHRELAIFSHDRVRGKMIYRQFVNEGYVLQYVCEITSQGARIVCETENVENGAGMRARETITKVNQYVFDEVFELAPPGEEFDVYLRNRWTRTPVIDGR